MNVKRCDICGEIKLTMIEFVIPKYGYERVDTCSKNGWGYELRESIYPISSHICPKCQKKIADFVKSISKDYFSDVNIES